LFGKWTFVDFTHAKIQKIIHKKRLIVHILDFFAPILAYFHDISFLFGKKVVILHSILYTSEKSNESI